MTGAWIGMIIPAVILSVPIMRNFDDWVRGKVGGEQ